MIDKNKQYKTRSGLPVEIYATDRGGKYPVHGAILKDGVWHLEAWTITGVVVMGCENLGDLIEVKPRIQITEWFNIYHNGVGRGCTTRQEADYIAGPGRKACIQMSIDCEEGEGL